MDYRQAARSGIMFGADLYNIFIFNPEKLWRGTLDGLILKFAIEMN